MCNSTFNIKKPITILMLLLIFKSYGQQCWGSIVAGSGTSYAIKPNGALCAWGANEYGKLGQGNTSSKSYPVAVGTDTDWVQVAGGSEHTIALKNDGTISYIDVSSIATGLYILQYNYRGITTRTKFLKI